MSDSMSDAVSGEGRGVPERVASYGTTLVHTETYLLPNGEYAWRRRPGPLAPAPFAPLSADTAELLSTVEADGLRLAVGRVEGEARTYRTAGGRSVASLVLHEGASDELVAPLRRLGRLLRALHETPVTQAPPAAGSRGMDRLESLLSVRTPHPRVGQAATQVYRVLGQERWARLAGWYREARGDDRLVLSHGGAGLGLLVTGGPPGTDTLLTGEDLCMAPWYVDVGWVVGELVEFRWQLPGEASVWQSLLDALFEGYGSDLGSDWPRLAALRVLLHVHDIAAYYEEVPSAGFDHYAGFLKFLTDL